MNFTELRRPKVSEAKTSQLVKLVDRFDTEGRFAEFSDQISDLQAALQSYIENHESEFLKERDYFKLRGEDNIFKYLQIESAMLRVCENDNLFESMARILAAKVCGVHIRVSLEEGMNNKVSQFLFRYSQKILTGDDMMKWESEAEMTKAIPDFDRVMYAKESSISDYVFERAAENLTFIVRTPPMMEGRLELLHFFEEQSISHSYHRYGNLGGRSLKN